MAALNSSSVDTETALSSSAAHAAVGSNPTTRHNDINSANNRFFMLASSYKKF